MIARDKKEEGGVLAEKGNGFTAWFTWVYVCYYKTVEVLDFLGLCLGTRYLVLWFNFLCVVQPGDFPSPSLPACASSVCFDFAMQPHSFKKVFYFRDLIEKSINVASKMFYLIKYTSFWQLHYFIFFWNLDSVYLVILQLYPLWSDPSVHPHFSDCAVLSSTCLGITH